MSMVITPDDGLILSGHSNSFGSSYDLLLIKTDSLGNVEWQKTYGGNQTEFGGQITMICDNQYIINKNTNDGSGTTTANIMKIDPTGEIIWEEAFPYNNYSEFGLRPIENPDGTFIVGGFVANSNNTAIGYLVKIDPQGNTVWSREYYTRSDISQYIYDIKPTTDSGYVFCGSAFPDTSNLQRAWVVKLDCFGCDSLLCYYPDSACQWYDCTQYPIDAYFTSSADTIDIKDSTAFTFINNSSNTTARLWKFGDGEVAYTSGTKQHTYTQAGDYEVELVVYHGMCTDTFRRTVTVINTTSVNELRVAGYRLRVVPNPARDRVRVSWVPIAIGAAPGSNHELGVYDLAGRKVKGYAISQGQNSREIDVSSLHGGVYLVRLLSGEREIGREKMVVE